MTIDRRKLAAVLAMIGSDFDGEALAAARRAHEMVKVDGLCWEDILTSDDAAVATEACRRLLAERDELLEQLARAKAETGWTPDFWVEPRTTREKIDRGVEFTEFLTGWEREFICTLAGWRGPLTPKQQQRLDELVDKLRRVARARGLAA